MSLANYSQFMGQLVTPDGEAIENHATILTHAANVIQHFSAMRESALRICLSLYHCKELFVQSGAKGWEKFCEDNFKELGISAGNIRSAVSAGRALTKYIEAARTRQEDVDMTHFETMSRSALTLLGHADESIRDELITRVVEISSTTEQAPTTREVQAEIDQLRGDRAKSEESLRSAENLLLAKDGTIERLNNLVRDRELELANLNEKLELAAESGETSSVVVEEADPNSKRIRQEIDTAESSLEKLKTELEVAKAALEKEKSALEKANRETARKQVALDSVAELEKALETLKARWTESLIAKITQADPHTYAPVFTRISTELRVLAEQIDPQLV